MSTILRIDGPAGRRDFSVLDCPIAVAAGETDGEAAIFGEAAESTAVAWLGHKDGEVFIEPSGEARSLRMNGSRLKSSAWLVAGDTIAVGQSSVAVGRQEGILTLSMVGRKGTGPVADLAPSGHDDPGRDATPSEGVAHPLVRIGRIGPIRRQRSRAFKVVVAVFLALMVGVVFVSVASPVRLVISPEPDSVSLRGVVPAVPFAGRYLVLAGNYVVVAEKSGFRRLEQQIAVAFGSEQAFAYELRELPGYLDVTTRPASAANVSVNGKTIGTVPLKGFALEPGRYEVRVDADRYRGFSQVIDVRGKGDTQSIEAELVPNWGHLEVTSEPSDAQVRIDGADVGVTPLRLQPLAGHHVVEVRKSGWRPASRSVRINANESLRLPAFKLEPAAEPRTVEPSMTVRAKDPAPSATARPQPDTGRENPQPPPAAAPPPPPPPPVSPPAAVDGTVLVTTSPAGATVTVNGLERGPSPTTLTLAPGRPHQIVAYKAGFETVTRTVTLEGGNRTSLHMDLAAQYGIVFLNTRPSGATLTLDGKSAGPATQRLQLTTTPHHFEISKPGYATQSVTVTPLTGVSKTIEITLQKSGESPGDAKAQGQLKTGGGQVLRLIRLDKPVRFQMGASRGEAGRRSNEAMYWVELTRSFHMSEKEVTNREFQKFNAQHSSGTEHGVDLNGSDQPVVSVSWDDAARYLNWLSTQDGLPPAYRESEGKMLPIQPPTIGYRLPTEAEWTFVARYEGGYRSMDQPLKFSWEGGMPPPSGSGNYADDTASGTLPLILKGYSDGYAASAPVGKYAPNKAGIFDLGGNVSEWIHDYYEVAGGRADSALRDPTGPATGTSHVVRGSSWRHGSITELRLSYRDDALKPRSDLGFRIVRYATDTSN